MVQDISIRLAAEVLGVDDQGAIEVGKRADIIALPGDPVADIDAVLKVNFVMKDGAIHKRPGAAGPDVGRPGTTSAP